MEILSEKSNGKLTHIEHPEDESLKGPHGFNTAIHSLEKVHRALVAQKKTNQVTTKYDGSPSIVFGRHPETNRFFVATKSAFNKTPKLNYNHTDIQKNHEGEGLRQKLSAALSHLPKVTPKKGIFQGDLMYTHDDLKKDATHVNFKPNTITYSLPKDSEEGQKALKAKIGVVVHTHYKGKTLNDMRAHFDPDHKSFGSHKDVHIIHPGTDLSKTTYSPQLNQEYNQHLKLAYDAHKKISDEGHEAIAKHRDHLNIHINSAIRDNKLPSFSGYIKHLENRKEADVGSVKTPSGKTAKESKWNSHIAHAVANKENINNALVVHSHLGKAKNALVGALSSNTTFGHSIDGKPSKPEGFVTTHKGNPIKLVDRNEFSRSNFNQEKSWKK